MYFRDLCARGIQSVKLASLFCEAVALLWDLSKVKYKGTSFLENAVF